MNHASDAAVHGGADAPAGRAPDREAEGLPTRPGLRAYVLVTAWLLIGAHLVLRAWTLGERHFYADDLMYGGEAIATPLLSAEYLVENRHGHVMPAAVVLHGVLYRLFPLEWGPFAVTLLVLSAAAALAVLRLLRVLLDDRPALLAPLAVFLFCPLTLGPVTWWSAAINSLPLQIGMAWVVADAVLLARTRRRRHAVSGTVAFVVTLLFFERAVFVPFLAFALVALLLHLHGARGPVRSAWLRAWELWAGLLVAVAAWAVVFLVAVPAESVGTATAGQVADLTRISATALAPALLGGPWRWVDVSGPPLSDAPSWAVPASVAVLVALVAWSTLLRRGGGWLWVVAAGYVLAGAVVVGIGRGATEFAHVLPLTYRYFAAEAVLAAVVVAFLFLLPARRAGDRRPAAGARAGVVTLLVLAFVASSVLSTVTYRRAWATEPTGDYLTAARASLAGAGDEPLLDFDVPDTVLWDFWSPWNQASLLFAGLEDRPRFAAATHDLRLLDEAGNLRPAAVVPVARVADGPLPGCGWSVAGDGRTPVALAGPVPAREWTAELSYTADIDGTVTVSLDSGKPVHVPVRAGSHTVHVRLEGGGQTLHTTAQTPGLGLCIGAGALGDVVPQGG
ncbi:hypothetical protein [Candidatus Blastococcus massiliensis]|uniref:hypothetical protein n=1 Tax=Candidatus Blastococcus massiliensis TaxID=1470358 RepID=UPI0004AD34EA|nr:hypothetical protein [Candidatus Blastococcus massiliensis]